MIGFEERQAVREKARVIAREELKKKGPYKTRSIYPIHSQPYIREVFRRKAS